MKQALRLPPGTGTLSPLGDLLPFQRDLFGASFRAFQAHGDIVRLRFAWRYAYLVSNPAYIRHFLLDNATNYPKGLAGPRGIVAGPGLSTSEGPQWLRHRRMMQPGFHRDRTLEMVGPIAAATTRILDRRWAELARSGEPFVTHREMVRLVIEILFQVTLSEEAPPDFSDAIYTYLTSNIRPKTLGDEVYARVPLSLAMRRRIRAWREPAFYPAAYRIDGLARETVKRRRAEGPGRGDLFDSFLTTTDEKGVGFDDLELRDELVDTLLGGHVSTAISLCWTWLVLEQHPEIAERLHAEVDRAIGGRTPTGADLPALEYVTRVIEEVLRLYPPAPGLTRPAIKDDKFGEYDVPAGTSVMTSGHLMHRHPAYWTEPERFDPDRFLPEQVQKRPRFVYLPFGVGQRVCIGAQLALRLLTVVVSMASQRYRIALAPGKPVVPAIGGTHYPRVMWTTLSSARSRSASATAPDPRTAS